MEKFKNSKKAIAILLTSTSILSFLPQANAKSTVKDFLNEHKVLSYMLKASAAIGGALTVGVGGYYVGNTVLNIIKPERAQEKKLCEEALKKKRVLQKELLEVYKEDNDDDKITEINRKIADVQNTINLCKSKESALEVIKGVPIVGAAVTCAGLAFNVLDLAGSMSKKITSISYLRYAGDHLKKVKEDIVKLFEPSPREHTKDEVFNKFDTIFEGIEGQDEAIKEVKNHLYDIVVAKNQAAWKGEKYSHGDVLYFHGPSGVGKSSVSKKIAEALYSNPKVYTVTTSDVDTDKKDSVVTQLFGSPSNMNNPYFPLPVNTNSLANFLKSNPNSIVKIEEYDKICTPALDEVLRTIMECGIVNINGEKVDCSGMLFILTSNEDKVSMEGFEKSDESKLDKDSLSKGYTRVWHDKSFLNRIRKVEFKNLNSDAYKKILKKHFEDINSYWSDSKNAGIKLKIDEESINNLSLKIEKMNQGARPIDLSILPVIQGEIGNKIKAAPSLDFYKDRTFNVSYDPEKEKFSVDAN